MSTCSSYDPLPKRYSRELGQVIVQLLHVDPLERWSVEQVLKSPAAVQRAHPAPSIATHLKATSGHTSQRAPQALQLAAPATRARVDCYPNRATCIGGSLTSNGRASSRGCRLQAAVSSRPPSAGAKSAIYQLYLPSLSAQSTASQPDGTRQHAQLGTLCAATMQLRDELPAAGTRRGNAEQVRARRSALAMPCLLHWLPARMPVPSIWKYSAPVLTNRYLRCAQGCSKASFAGGPIYGQSAAAPAAPHRIGAAMGDCEHRAGRPTCDRDSTRIPRLVGLSQRCRARPCRFRASIAALIKKDGSCATGAFRAAEARHEPAHCGTLKLS